MAERLSMPAWRRLIHLRIPGERPSAASACGLTDICIMTLMKAVRWYGQKDLRIEEVPEPQVSPDQVKLRVRACGICGSDIHEYNSGPILVPHQHPHPLTGVLPPVTLGHEFSGELVEVGNEVKGFRRGSRVVVFPTLLCFGCPFCRNGQYNLCQRLGTIGFAMDGGLAEYCTVPAFNCYEIPDQLTYQVAAFTEPLAVAVHAWRRSRARLGEAVTVVGAGAVGLLILQVALAGGAEHVFVVEPSAARRRLALDLGATDAIDPQEKDVGRHISERTEGLRSSVSFECAGSVKALKAAEAAVGRGGRIVVVGLYEGEAPIDLWRMFLYEKSLIASSAYDNEFPIALGLLRDGRVQVKPMITQSIPLKDTVQRGMEIPNRQEFQGVRTLVEP